MSNIYLEQGAPNGGDGGASSPYNDPKDAQDASSSGDIVNVTPLVLAGRALPWSVSHVNTNGVEVKAGVTWRVDPAHCAATSANRLILPYFTNDTKQGHVFRLGAGSALRGFRANLGRQPRSAAPTTKLHVIQVNGANVEITGCVYLPEGEEWSDDPDFLGERAYWHMQNRIRIRFVSVKGNQCLIQDCAGRLSSNQYVFLADQDVMQTTISGCDFRGAAYQVVMMAAGTNYGEPARRGLLIEDCNLSLSSSEDGIQTFGRDEGPGGSEDPDDLPRVNGMMVRRCALGGWIAENAWDPKNGQLHLVEQCLIDGHPGCGDGPYKGGATPQQHISFSAMSGAAGNYHSRQCIVRDCVIAGNANGINVRSRAVYNNIIVSNRYNGPDGDWENLYNSAEHKGVNISANDSDGWTFCDNIVGQHTTSQLSGARTSFEVSVPNNPSSSNRADGNCYFNSSNGFGGPRFGTPTADVDGVNFTTYKAFMASLSGGEQNSEDVTADLPLFVNFGGVTHIVDSTGYPTNFDGYDYAIRGAVRASIRTGGRGAAVAVSGSSGTTITLDRSWAFFEVARYGNPGAAHGRAQVSDWLMNLRTGDKRQIASMPLTRSGVLNGQITLASSMTVQAGDRFARIPAGWSLDTIPRGLISWTGAGVNAASGQGGQFGDQTEPPPPPQGGPTSLQMIHGVAEFAGTEGTVDVTFPGTFPTADTYSIEVTDARGLASGDVAGTTVDADWNDVSAGFKEWLVTGNNVTGARFERLATGGATTVSFVVKRWDASKVAKRWEGLLTMASGNSNSGTGGDLSGAGITDLTRCWPEHGGVQFNGASEIRSSAAMVRLELLDDGGTDRVRAHRGRTATEVTKAYVTVLEMLDPAGAVVTVAHTGAVASAIEHASVPGVGDWSHSVIVPTVTTTNAAEKSDDCSAYVWAGVPAVEGTATGGGASALLDAAQSWSTDEFTDRTVAITGGTGAGQVRVIASNSATQLAVGTAWATQPDATSEYEIYGTVKHAMLGEAAGVQYNSFAVTAPWLDVQHLDSLDGAGADLLAGSAPASDSITLPAQVNTALSFLKYCGGTEQTQSNMPTELQQASLAVGGTAVNVIRPWPSHNSPWAVQVASAMAGGGTLLLQDDFSGTSGTSAAASSPEVDAVGDGWNRVGLPELDGAGNCVIPATWESGAAKPGISIVTGVADPRLTVRVHPDNAAGNWSIFVRGTAVVDGELWSGYVLQIRHGQPDVRLGRYENGVPTYLHVVPLAVPQEARDYHIQTTLAGNVQLREGPAGGAYDDATLLLDYVDPAPLPLGTLVGAFRLSYGTPALIQSMEALSLSDATPAPGVTPGAPSGVAWVWTGASEGNATCGAVAGADLYLAEIDGVVVAAATTPVVPITDMDATKVSSLTMRAAVYSGRMGPASGSEVVDAVELRALLRDADDTDAPWANKTGLHYVVYTEDPRAVGGYDASSNPGGAVLVHHGTGLTTDASGVAVIQHPELVLGHRYMVLVGEALPLDGTQAKIGAVDVQATLA